MIYLIYVLDSEPFTDSIPMSQTDALMGIVDLDQLFDKDQKSNAVNNQNKDLKLKPTASIKKMDIIKSTTSLSNIDTSNVSASSSNK